MAAVLLAMPQPVSADDEDPFMKDDAPEEVRAESGQAPPLSDSFSITAFFGSDSAGNQIDPYKNGNRWTDLDTVRGSLTDDEQRRLVEESAEMRMHRELQEELPKREPFGDKLEDVERRLNR